MKNCEQRSNVAITEVAGEMVVKGMSRPINRGKMRIDSPEAIAGDLLHYLGITRGHSDLAANIKTIRANSADETQWSLGILQIVNDAWQMKELDQDVALTFIARVALLPARERVRGYALSAEKCGLPA